MPRMLKGGLYVLLALVLMGAAGALALMGFVYYMETHLPEQIESDVIIVLGAQVKEDGTPSVALERRLTAALQSYQEKQQTIIVCGAQGGNEPRAEGDVMRDWTSWRKQNHLIPARTCKTPGRSCRGAVLRRRWLSPVITM